MLQNIGLKTLFSVWFQVFFEYHKICCLQYLFKIVEHEDALLLHFPFSFYHRFCLKYYFYLRVSAWYLCCTRKRISLLLLVGVKRSHQIRLATEMSVRYGHHFFFWGYLEIVVISAKLLTLPYVLLRLK